MKKSVCINCIEYKRCRDSYVSWLFFIIGLVATIAIRVVTVLMNLHPAYGKAAWYIGVSGFFIFFLYKYRVNQTRAHFINDRNLVDKINQQKELTEDDYKLMSAILCGLSSKKERVNYIFIFSLSLIALLLAIYFDIFG